MSCVDNIWGTNFLPFFEEFMIAVEQDNIGILELVLKRITYWSLVATGLVFAWAVFCVDNCWKTQFLGQIFESFMVDL